MTIDWTASRNSTFSFSLCRKRRPTALRETMMPAVPTTQQELAALAVHQHHAAIVIRKLTIVKTTYPQCACKSDRPLCKRMLVL